jgi:SAM-dependent methyltransferase
VVFFKNCTNLFTGYLKVLHFAPEAGLQRKLKSLPTLTHVSADLSLRLADERFDICDIPHPADSFDVVLCSHVLEHVPDDRKAISELYR